MSTMSKSDQNMAVVTGSDEMIKTSEHWTVENGKATSIWVAYFEPQPCWTSLASPTA